MKREEVAHQVRMFLKRHTREGSTRWSINELRIVLALERMVARLSVDPQLSSHLIYKGGFVLFKEYRHQRFTRDLDALARGIDKAQVEKTVPKVLVQDLEDGFWFGDIQVRSIDDQGEYGSLRFDCAYQIGDPPEQARKINKLSRIHLDVGFGDALPQEIESNDLRVLNPFGESVSWKVYPLEYILSEKLQTLVIRGSANSRARDVYDIYHLIDRCRDKEALSEAIQKTFKARSTALPSSFQSFCSRLNFNVLAQAWNSLQVQETPVSFHLAWYELKDKLAKLDPYLK